jgi:hypothetical protein
MNNTFGIPFGTTIMPASSSGGVDSVSAGDGIAISGTPADPVIETIDSPRASEMVMVGGTDQSTATPITAGTGSIIIAVNATGASGEGVLFPAAVEGLLYRAVNGNNVTVMMYPASGEMFVETQIDNPVPLPPLAMMTAQCFSAGIWAYTISTALDVPMPFGASDTFPALEPVVTVALSDITLSGEQTISGVAAVIGDRVLVAGQTAPEENGVYDVDAGAWARSADALIGDDIYNRRVYVRAGNEEHTYYNCIITPSTFGTDPVVFVLDVSGIRPIHAYEVIGGNTGTRQLYPSRIMDMRLGDARPVGVSRVLENVVSLGTFSGAGAEATATLNVEAASHFKVVSNKASGTLTIGNVTNVGPVDTTQTITLRVIQLTTTGALAFDTMWDFGTVGAPAMPANANEVLVISALVVNDSSPSSQRILAVAVDVFDV